MDAYHSRKRYVRTSAEILCIESTAPGFDNRTSEHDKIRTIRVNGDSHSHFYSHLEAISKAYQSIGPASNRYTWPIWTVKQKS